MSDKLSLSRVRWGLLSTAHINRSLIPPILHSKHSELVAIASRNPEKAVNYARDWNIPKAYGSYEDLLTDPEIDVIYNSLPNSLHTEWTVKALNSGKHVLCEKPMCLNTQEVDEIQTAAQKNGKFVTEAFMYRHHPQTLKVKEIVDKGMIGELRFFRGSFSFQLDRLGDPREDLSMGGGSIWDVGCYPISYARYIIGSEPEEVFGWQRSGPTGIDTIFAGQMRFTNELLAQFDSGFDAPYRVGIEIVGSQGSMMIPNPYKPGKKEKIMLSRQNSSEVIPISGQELYIGEVMDMENAILHNQPPLISLADSRGNVIVINALLQSAKLSQPVHL